MSRRIEVVDSGKEFIFQQPADFPVQHLRRHGAHRKTGSGTLHEHDNLTDWQAIHAENERGEASLLQSGKELGPSPELGRMGEAENTSDSANRASMNGGLKAFAGGRQQVAAPMTRWYHYMLSCDRVEILLDPEFF
jgi:hypothetical protein